MKNNKDEILSCMAATRGKVQGTVDRDVLDDMIDSEIKVQNYLR